jgi:O-antigen/teichoic acid export membrane protein
MLSKKHLKFATPHGLFATRPIHNPSAKASAYVDAPFHIFGPLLRWQYTLVEDALVILPDGVVKVRLRSLVNKVRQNSFLRSVALLASATAAGQLLTLLFTPLLTRLYSPTEFGLLAVFNALFAIIVVASSFRYEMAIPLPKTDADARVLVAISLAANAIIAAAFLLLCLLFGNHIAYWLGAPQIERYLPLVSLVLLGGGSFKVLTYWSVRKATFKNFAKAKISQAIANISIQIFAGIAGFGVLGLIIGQFFGYTAGTIKLLKSVEFTKEQFDFRYLAPRARALAKFHARFPLYDTPGAIINVFSTQLPNIVLAMLFGPGIAGFYMLADRVLSTPAALLSQAIGQVLFSRSGNDSNRSNLKDIAATVAFQLTVLTIPAVLVIYFGGEVLFSLIFGKTWHDAGTYACWLSVGMGPLFIYGSISLVLPATGGQTLNLYIHSSILVLRMVAMGLGAYVNSPSALVMAYSAMNAVGYSIAIVLVFRHLRAHSLAANYSSGSGGSSR